MGDSKRSLDDTLAGLPGEWPVDVLPEIRREAQGENQKVVVLDDDPTGTQTVHSVPVLTEWPVERMAEEFLGESAAVYLLTNSRSLPLNEARALNRRTGEQIRQASRQSGVAVTVISRSDSTLRGHFPGEVAALAEGLGARFDAWLIIPCFPEGGRLTIGDVHYVVEGDHLTPAGETEFARDKTFGYRSSNLRAWVEEKTGGSPPAERVASISLDMLRQGGPEETARHLLGLPAGSMCVVNAVTYRDLEVLALATLRAEAAGKRYLFRSAASFVRARAGIGPRALLTAADLDLPAQGAGLVIAGSYVPKTSAQLETLMAEMNIQAVEVQVPRLLEESQRVGEIERATREVNRRLGLGQDTLVYTSRTLVSVAGAEANLEIGRTVSESLVAITRGLNTRPRYLLAKGGITSSDIAMQGLGIRRGWVLGQVLPGVSAWRAGEESLFPGLAYIVFPGNVGGKDALEQVVRMLGHA